MTLLAVGITASMFTLIAIGMPVGFALIYIVSLMTKEPSAEMQAFIDEIRKPRGRTVLQEKD